MHLPASIRRTLAASLALAALLPAAAAQADTRYSTPAATATAGACSAALPCRIDHAVNGAIDGDEVVVGPGTYEVTVPLDARAIDLHGEPGGPAPQLNGAPDLAGDLLTMARGGSSVRHLALRSEATALHLEEGLAEHLTVTSAHGDAAELETSADTTVLRDSVVITEASDRIALILREGSGSSPSLAVRNATVLAPSGFAVRCEAGAGHTATLRNVIARGETADVDATGGSGCSAAYSSLRPAHSLFLAPGHAIQIEDPNLRPDRRPNEDSPTIDAGAADAWTSATDPDGRARTIPDIGVYEGVADEDDGDGGGGSDAGAGDDGAPPPTPILDPPTTGEVAPVSGVQAPVLGESVVVAPSGHVFVRRPGTQRFRKLEGAAVLPSGTVVDARRGRIRLTTALAEDGRFQSGRFWGSRFQVRQSATGSGMTTLALRGGDFRRCPRRSLARASAVPRENPTSRRVVRSLWARDRGGRFRTHGNNSVATARGTAWVTRDRCDGTVTRVHEGAVSVKDRRTGRTVLVRASRAYLARR